MNQDNDGEIGISPILVASAEKESKENILPKSVESHERFSILKKIENNIDKEAEIEV